MKSTGLRLGLIALIMFLVSGRPVHAAWFDKVKGFRNTVTSTLANTVARVRSSCESLLLPRVRPLLELKEMAAELSRISKDFTTLTNDFISKHSTLPDDHVVRVLIGVKTVGGAKALSMQLMRSRIEALFAFKLGSMTLAFAETTVGHIRDLRIKRKDLVLLHDLKPSVFDRAREFNNKHVLSSKRLTLYRNPEFFEYFTELFKYDGHRWIGIGMNEAARKFDPGLAQNVAEVLLPRLGAEERELATNLDPLHIGQTILVMEMFFQRSLGGVDQGHKVDVMLAKEGTVWLSNNQLACSPRVLRKEISLSLGLQSMEDGAARTVSLIHVAFELARVHSLVFRGFRAVPTGDANVLRLEAQ